MPVYVNLFYGLFHTYCVEMNKEQIRQWSHLLSGKKQIKRLNIGPIFQSGSVHLAADKTWNDAPRERKITASGDSDI